MDPSKGPTHGRSWHAHTMVHRMENMCTVQFTMAQPICPTKVDNWFRGEDNIVGNFGSPGVPFLIFFPILSSLLRFQLNLYCRSYFIPGIFKRGGSLNKPWSQAPSLFSPGIRMPPFLSRREFQHSHCSSICMVVFFFKVCKKT